MKNLKFLNNYFFIMSVGFLIILYCLNEFFSTQNTPILCLLDCIIACGFGTFLEFKLLGCKEKFSLSNNGKLKTENITKFDEFECFFEVMKKPKFIMCSFFAVNLLFNCFFYNFFSEKKWNHYSVFTIFSLIFWFSFAFLILIYIVIKFKKFEFKFLVMFLELFLEFCLVFVLKVKMCEIFKVNNFIVVCSCETLCYLVGSLNFSLLISKLFFKKDIRDFGSKNAGMTNMLRTFGLKSALFTFILDFSKGFFAIFVLNLALKKQGISEFSLIYFYNLLGLIALIFGHIFPIFFGFEGGKGVLVAAGAFAAVDLTLFLVALAIFLLLFCFSKIVSLGSIVASISILVIYVIHYLVLDYFLNRFNFNMVVNFLFMFIISAVIFLSHEKNIKRIYKKVEPKIGK